MLPGLLRDCEGQRGWECRRRLLGGGGWKFQGIQQVSALTRLRTGADSLTYPAIGLESDITMLWESYQQTRINAAERAAENADTKADRQAQAVAGLQRQVDRVSLACQALWEILRERTDITEEDLESKMLEIDGRDGMTDGKVGVQAIDCPACGRKTSSRRSSCVMCGAPMKSSHIFCG